MEAGESLGLQHREEIMLSKPEEDEVLTENRTLLPDKTFCMQVGLATRLVVSPATPEDWTVLKLNRRKVEREVLDQVAALLSNFQILCPPGKRSITSFDFEGTGCHCRSAIAANCGSGENTVDPLNSGTLWALNFGTLWLLSFFGTMQVPLRLVVVSLSPQRPALVLQQMTEMEIQVPENFPDEDEEEMEDNEGDDDGQKEDGDDRDPRMAAHEAPSSPPTFISRLASLFSSSDEGESGLKVNKYYVF